MKNFIKRKLWPVLAGLLTAFIVMMIFEYVNSLIFPLPEELDFNDTAALQAFTATLPWTAYILVLLGWIIGAFKAGVVTTFFSREQKYKFSFVVGVILTFLGIINNLVIGHDMVFNMIALPVFILFTYLGHKALKRLRGREVAVVQSL